MKSEPIYQFYAELRNYNPKKWRRLQVSGEVTMAQLDRILSEIFGMRFRSRYCFDVPVEENFKVCAGEYITNAVNQKALKLFRENPERAFCRIGLRVDGDYSPAGWAEDAEKTILKNVLTCENERMTDVCDGMPCDGMPCDGMPCDGRPIDLKLEKIIQNKLLESGVPHVTAGNGIDPDEINSRLKHC